MAPSFQRDQIRMRIEKRIQAFQNGYRQNVGLIGARGLGKTYLLSRIFEICCGQARLIPIYVKAETLDFDHFVDRWLGSLLSGFFLSHSIFVSDNFQSLLAAADPLIPKTVEKIRHLKKTLRREKNAASVRELLSLTGHLAEETGKKILLMIDEFQALAELPAPDPFSLFGREMMVEKDTFYLVASSSPMTARNIFRDKLSLLFGNFEVIELAPLGFEEIADLLKGRFPQLTFSQIQKNFLIRMTNGDGAHLDFLLDRLEFAISRDTSGELPTFQLLESFHKELFDSHGRVAQVFDKRLAACQRFGKDGASYVRTLLALSEGRRKVLSIAAYIERKTRETKKILQRLVQEDIIVKRGSFYVLEDPLFRFWLREVFVRRSHLYALQEDSLRTSLTDALERAFHEAEAGETMDITARVESLFKEFHNDVIEIDHKKMQCPQFTEIAFRPTNGRVFPLFAKNSKVRWFCQIAKGQVREEDVAIFLEELKQFRKKVQRKILITLGGIEQNAKLMAQAAKIQLWDLRSFNTLLDLYNLPKVILISQKEKDESDLGTLAQSVYSS